MRKLNKKGVAMLLVASMVLVAIPVTLVMLNLSSSQKEQTLHYNNVLNVEQISLSGINMGYSKLKSGYDRGYRIFPGEISGKDRFDLNMTPTGTGFFSQDIYLLLSKSKEGKNSSIIMADAEQFQQEDDPKAPVLVITHDYWTTPEPFELGVAKDVIAMKNFRGADQLRALDVKKFEMDCDEDTYKNMMLSLRNNLPPAVNDVWDTVVENATNDKIYGDDTPQPDRVGAGYKTVSNKSGSSKGSNNKPASNKTDAGTSSSSGGSSNSGEQGLDSMDYPTSTSSGGMSNPSFTGHSKGGNTDGSDYATQQAAKAAEEARKRDEAKRIANEEQARKKYDTGHNTTADIEREKGERRLREQQQSSR